MAKKRQFNPRVYMELAIERMKDSINEPRDDGKASPKVGAVLIKPDGSEETSYRGELRYGDHAEFSLLERKNRKIKLDGSILFTTLEPCAPGARSFPKLSCAERIVNARIKEVWIGIEDPDPSVDRKGIKHLENHKVVIHMFDKDLQDTIRIENRDFISQAEERAKNVEHKKSEVLLSKIENKVTVSSLKDFSTSALSKFLTKAKINYQIGSTELNDVLIKLGILSEVDAKPTGIGILLFGNRPELVFQQAIVKGEFIRKDGRTDINDFSGPLVSIPNSIIDWVESKLGTYYEVKKFEGEKMYDFPIKPFRESIINALAHRDYDIDGAPIYFKIDENKVIVKSPGYPVKPITIEQLNDFSAPTLSRNPKIMFVFNQLHLVEQRGKGMELFKELPSKYELPLPHYSFEDPYLTITFYRTDESIKDLIGDEKFNQLNKDEIKGFIFVYNNKSISKAEYSRHFGFKDDKKAQRHLAKFKKLELVDIIGAGPSTKYIFIDKD